MGTPSAPRVGIVTLFIPSVMNVEETPAPQVAWQSINFTPGAMCVRHAAPAKSTLGVKRRHPHGISWIPAWNAPG